MKRLLLFVFIILTIFLSSCFPLVNNEFVGNKKQEVVENLYGDVEYISEGIFIHKNLKELFKNVDGVDYIITNSGSRGSVAPEIRNNFYLLMDIVNVDNEYKLLIYNNIMKKSANIDKMFILCDYFLQITIDEIINFIDEYELNQNINQFKVSFTKKESELDYHWLNDDEVTKGFYLNQNHNEIILSFNDSNTGNTIIASTTELLVVNSKEEKVYLEKEITNKEINNLKDNSLNDDKIEFSLNKGLDYNLFDDRIKEFDIYNTASNLEVKGMIFFFAFTYEVFEEKVHKNLKPNIYTYNFPDEKYFEYLLELYDEEYFEDNILIFYYKYEPNISLNYVHSVTKNDNSLTLNVNRFEGMATALSSWLEIITVRKSDIGNIDNINVVVRTISNLQNSVVVYIKNEYIRDFYVNGLTIDDFKNLDNLKNINTWTSSLNVDLVFNRSISDQELTDILLYLENSSNIKSIGYKGKDFIRVQLEHKLFDKFVNKTLSLKEIVDKDIIEEYSLTHKLLNPALIGYVELFLEKHGKEYGDEMLNNLKKGNFPFLKFE